MRGFALLFCAIFGYLLGNLNPAYLFSKMRGFDIREEGSGNAGASNALIMMGKAVGLVCALLDILKAYLSVKIAALLFPAAVLAGQIAGTFCILGHIYPVFMKFKGGKGLASLGGVILAFDAKLFLIMLAFEGILVFLVDYLIVVPLSACVAYPVLYFFFTGSVLGALIFLPVTLAMFSRHRENFERIAKGTELHFSYLWNREEEIARVQANQELWSAKEH